MKSLKRICDIEFDTGVEIFDAGQRKVFITLTERGIRIRGGRQTATKFVTWQRLYDVGALQAADFQPVARTGRIRRGAVC